jgi:hypothetical protein
MMIGQPLQDRLHIFHASIGFFDCIGGIFGLIFAIKHMDL